MGLRHEPQVHLLPVVGELVVDARVAGATFLHATRAVPRDHVREEIEQRSSPSGAVVYEAVRKEGEDELDRNKTALGWSGLAAGLSMGFSFAAFAVGYLLPSFIGNVIGGVSLVAALAHAQFVGGAEATEL